MVQVKSKYKYHLTLLIEPILKTYMSYHAVKNPRFNHHHDFKLCISKLNKGTHKRRQSRIDFSLTDLDCQPFISTIIASCPSVDRGSGSNYWFDDNKRFEPVTNTVTKAIQNTVVREPYHIDCQWFLIYLFCWTIIDIPTARGNGTIRMSKFPTGPRSSLDHYENEANKLKFQKIRGYRYDPFSWFL